MELSDQAMAVSIKLQCVFSILLSTISLSIALWCSFNSLLHGLCAGVVHTIILKFCALSLKATLSNSHPLSVRKREGGPKYTIQNQNTMLIISDFYFDFIIEATLYQVKWFIKWRTLAPLISFMSIDTISLKCFAKKKPTMSFCGVLLYFKHMS